MSEVKQIFLIRHGETLKNRQSYHQGPDEPLSERGREQVADLIEYLRDKNIDTLICSNYARAKETAGLIGESLNLNYTIEPSVREFGRPATLYDRHHFSFASFRFFLDLYRNRLNILWDKDGAENLAHIRERVRDARIMLEKQEGKRIAVVSHRMFMTMFTETVCYDRPLSLFKFFWAMLGRKRVPNTTTLHFACQPPLNNNTCSWILEETVLPPYN